MKKYSLILLAIILLHPRHSVAEVINHRVTFSKSDLKFSRLNEYDIVTLKGLEVSDKVGEPLLPIAQVQLIIPEGETIDRVEIIAAKAEELTGVYNILPVQKPEILSSVTSGNQRIEITSPKTGIYTADQSYPTQIVAAIGSNYIGTVNVASIRVYPLQYHPLKKTLHFYSEIIFQLVTTPDHQTVHKKSTSAFAQSLVFDSIVRNLVANPEAAKITAETDHQLTPTHSGEEYQYVIITGSGLEKYFKTLRDWKHQKGVPAKVITIEWIYENYSGKDRPEKIRNFIRYAYENWGTIWILLGGDTNIIPHRSAFAMDCEFGGSSTENDIPCDLYYADLDGSWNDDGDAVYGEIADKIDMYPEVILGRAPVENANEADTFVKKVIQYEKNPSLGYQRDILFAAEILWDDPYTDTGIAKDMIEASYFPPGFYSVTKLYQDRGNESIASVREAINRGQHLINHHGHASTNLMGMGEGYFSKNDMSALANRSKQSILYSIGCYPANFEADCIAEAFLNNPTGGGVAFIGNSRYGWGSPGNPGYGYSDRFDDQFFKFLFAEKQYSLGLALALAKATYIPFSREENVYRWCMYEITLLGDPEMPIWTDIPDTLSVQYPAAIISANEIVIPVTVTAHGTLVEHARVCLMQDDIIYRSLKTDAAGQVRFAITSASPATPISLTVTAPNFLPVERSIEVTTDAPFVVCTGYSIDDDQGNSDGLLNPFERVKLKIKLQNFGSQPATAVQAKITAKNDSLSIIKDEIPIGDIAANDSIESSESFELAIPFDSRNGANYFCDLKLAAGNGAEWNQIISLVCATPVLIVNHVDFIDTPNRNGIPEPGEAMIIIPTFMNQGKSVAHDVKIFFTTDDPRLRVAQEIKTIGNLDPGESVVDSFIVSIPENYSTLPSFPKFEFSITTADGYFFQTQFSAAIGNTGFFENFDSGNANWQLPGSSDNQWHITQKNFHSGARSFYCGDEQSGTYRKNNESIIESPSFYLGQNAQLSFWAKYNVAIYGVNGFYVRLFDGNEWHKLDFIGSGGALDSTLMGNDWLPYDYDLSHFAPGTLAKVQFHWVSDDEPLPEGISGVFLDDVMVESNETSIQNNMAGERTLPVKHQLDQNFPNPFNSSTTISYKIAENSYQQIELSIYNLSGQKVKSLVNRYSGPGYYTVMWDGRNDVGNQVASSVYLYQLHVGKSLLKKKLLLIR